ncbi:hypothetical protein SAMN05421858_4744 [Haladaptatus litoreus]|uniref:Uncharacterized protein n=1 Tax=Haladaptatus litoreus TaxID=553468 RepID=A0A1N7F2F5_9EURY|nr:hypothetical protein SAMN05421858_4744 [Haladaptatus litoreus]
MRLYRLIETFEILEVVYCDVLTVRNGLYHSALNVSFTEGDNLFFEFLIRNVLAD